MLWGKRKQSAATLKDRLELVLAYDRAKLPPGQVDELRRDLMDVLRRYFPESSSDVDIEQSNGRMCLRVELPIGTRPGQPAP